ncbi:aquaporin-11-like [Megalops cyprinoides]|uniref:aquaporin-11-like n=1 Tax=Megalops cyprinoides TaxID=118141 RepID=UPI001863EC60|nr:aquaporin-11-like [Megalops cyprinoides]
MEDLGISLLLLTVVVLVSEATRITTTKFVSRKDYAIYLTEIISTFQLCACTHELKLLGEVGQIESHIGLTLTYIATVIHTLTFHEAIGNPSGTLERVYRRNLSGKSALALIGCQFIAATMANAVVAQVWALGLSDLHHRHKRFGFKCTSPIHAALPTAVAVELACAFVVQTAVTQMHRLDEKYRVHAMAAVVTALVYAGGSVTGAVFNPALAFSIQFPCSGNTFMEYSLVYWLGPVLGMASSVLLFDKITLLLSRKSVYQKDADLLDSNYKKIQ